jgi:hypothetical protein
VWLHLTLPLLIPQIIFVIIKSALWTLQVYILCLLICIYAISANLSDFDLEFFRINSCNRYPPLIICLLEFIECNFEFIHEESNKIKEFLIVHSLFLTPIILVNKWKASTISGVFSTFKGPIFLPKTVRYTSHRR